MITIGCGLFVHFCSILKDGAAGELLRHEFMALIFFKREFFIYYFGTASQTSHTNVLAYIFIYFYFFLAMMEWKPKWLQRFYFHDTLYWQSVP